MMSPDAVRAFSERFGGRFALEPHVRRLYAYDATGVLGMPDAVLYPASAGDVADAARLAAEHCVPLVARGSGTGLSGGAVPEHGGLLISFEHMRRVLSIDTGALRIRVEPGVINMSLENVLDPLALFYPPDPASHRISSLGGNLAENSGGPRAVKYGVTGNHVTRLWLVDANGHVGDVTCGPLQHGCDLVSLVVGSEGTLALITSAELSLERRPAAIATVLLSFSTMARATDYISAMIAEGILPAAAEFMDRNTIRTVEAWGVATYAPGAAAVLLIDLDGTEAEIEAAIAPLRALAERLEALDLRVARDEAEREAVWLGRRGSFGALSRRSTRILIQDVTVPRNRLTEMLQVVEDIAERYNLHTAMVGHAGDGNLHPDFPYDSNDAEMVDRVHRANVEILSACIAMDGSITGEHGIGSDKLPQLPLMYGPAELGLMAEVRRTLDPDLRLNPGKAVPLVPRVRVDGQGHPYPEPSSAEEMRDAILHARSMGSRLRVTLDRLHGITVDPENMVMEVAAGETFDAVRQALSGVSLRFPVTPLREEAVARALLCNDYGPDHLRQGLFRQALLACRYVTGAGEIVRMGRPVVKNVAGYDLFRPLIGSLGRLGVPLSFTFRLTPDAPGDSYTRQMERSDLLSLAAMTPRPHSLFALPDGERYAVFGSFTSPPEGWRKLDDLKGTLAGATADDMSDLLDLAVPPQRLPALLERLSSVPIIVLPAAGRVLTRLDRGSAIRLVGELEASGFGPLRAAYGADWEPLGTPDPLAQAWETALQRVFDPDGILTEWLKAE